MKKLRQFKRAVMARWFPFWFARWVNRDRCNITIDNDPSGLWTVTIGMVGKCQHQKLGLAMSGAFWQCERDPNWQWVCDYLREM